jgi:hypothetical protein
MALDLIDHRRGFVVVDQIASRSVPDLDASRSRQAAAVRAVLAQCGD